MSFELISLTVVIQALQLVFALNSNKLGLTAVILTVTAVFSDSTAVICALQLLLWLNSCYFGFTAVMQFKLL